MLIYNQTKNDEIGRADDSRNKAPKLDLTSTVRNCPNMISTE